MYNKKSWVLQKVKMIVNIDGISDNPSSLNIFDYPYLRAVKIEKIKIWS